MLEAPVRASDTVVPDQIDARYHDIRLGVSATIRANLIWYMQYIEGSIAVAMTLR